ncbi:MAG: hypothetical protein R3244_10235 [Thermoanaerobaculia bacterium]|nr:hypothetical protein [Thermoanaerobaculia bacterium]
MNAESYANLVLRRLASLEPASVFLAARARGKTAVLGFEDEGEWVPLFRIANGSASFNVADLQIRHGRRWEPSFVRGVPDKVADALAGEFRFLWQFHSQLN